jgi:hypothetical protein
MIAPRETRRRKRERKVRLLREVSHRLDLMLAELLNRDTLHPAVENLIEAQARVNSAILWLLGGNNE